MSISHLLEDFGVFANSSSTDITEVLLEESRLEAFEKGYQAGWDDSAKAKSEEASHISTAFAQSLSELSFTYDEAYAGVLKGLKPLLQQIVCSVLPSAAQQTLGPRLVDMIDELVREHGRQPVQFHVAKDAVGTMTNLLDTDADLTAEVHEDPTLIDGQIRLSFGTVSEQEIDLARLIQNISEAIDAFFTADTFDTQKDIAS